MGDVTVEVTETSTAVSITETSNTVEVTETDTTLTVENNFTVEITEENTDITITETSNSVDVTETETVLTLGTNFVTEKETGVEIPLQSENYYCPPSTSSASAQYGTNIVYWIPMTFDTSTTLSRLGAILTATATSNRIKLGIYSNSSQNKPETKLAETSAIETGTGQSLGFKYGDISLTVSRGLYWLAFLNQGTVPSNFYGYSFAEKFVSQGTFASPPTNVNIQFYGFWQTGVTGDLPTSPSPAYKAGIFPRVYVGVA